MHGSGTTLAAAERLSRRWLGIDQSPLAQRIAEARLTALCSALSTSTAREPNMDEPA